MNIKPLHAIFRHELRDLAYAAAERGECRHQANVFEAGPVNHAHFEHDYHAHELAIEGGQE